MDERAGEAQLLLHAARELAGEACAELAHAGSGQQPVRALFANMAGTSNRVGVETDVLVDREVLVETEPLRHVADMLLALLGVRHDVDAVDDDVAAVRLHHAGQHPHGRGLAGAVGTDQAENLAAIHRETETIHGGNGSEPLGQPIGRNNGSPGAFMTCPGEALAALASAGMPGTSSWVGL